jgi:hypothetical protein
MKNINEIRFVATNYFNLQGLRMVPIGVLGILVAIWVNGAQYPVTKENYFFLILIVIVSLALYFGIDRYYLHSFGKVKNTPESKRLEWLVSIVAGVLTLGAFWMDITYKLPLCLVGLVFGVGLLEEYIRITWLVKGRHLLYYPIGAVLAIVVSLLPLLGLPKWWHAFGLKDQLLGILLYICLFSIFAGIWGHIFLVRTLSPKAEEK